MSTPTSQVSGLVSGIDWETTIKQLLSIEGRQQTLLANRKSQNDTKLSLWAQVQAKVQSLQSAMTGIDQRSEFAIKSATSSDSSLVAVSASAAAAEGTHTIQVLQLARAHTIAAQGWTDKNSTGVGDQGGDLTIQVGSKTVTVADADLSSATTLEDLKSLINNAASNDGLVTASIVDDGSGSHRYRLELTADNTGTDNRITVSSNPTDLNFSTTAIDTAETRTGWTGTSTIGTSGTYTGTANKSFVFSIGGSGAQTVGTDTIAVNWVDSLGNTGSFQLDGTYTPGSNITVADGVQVSFDAGSLTGGDQFNVDVFNPNLVNAQDAQVKVDGIYMNKPTNIVTDAIEGVSLNLLAVDPNTTVNIGVANDTAGVKSKIMSFVNAYNSLMSDMSNYTAYDETNKTAAPLLGDGFISEVRSQLTNSTSQAMSGLQANARFDSLAVVGIKGSTGGQLSVDDTALDDALNNHFEDVVNLFTQTFSSGDSKLSFVASNEHTQSGTYALAFSYDASGAISGATINGQAATIDGQMIFGAKGTATEGLAISFAPPAATAGTVNTTIRFGKGVAASLASDATQITDPDSGPIHFAMDNLNSANDSLNKQISMWDDRLKLTEEQLRRQFTNLETAISQMKNQSSTISRILG